MRRRPGPRRRDRRTPSSPGLPTAAGLWAGVAFIANAGGVSAQETQNPSPMVETTRAHERVEVRDLPGVRVDLEGILARPVRVYAPSAVKGWTTGPEEAARGDSSEAPHLLVHFHGSPHVAEAAAHDAALPHVVAAVHLGAGSAVYESPFEDPEAFHRLVEEVTRTLGAAGRSFSRIDVSAFSAGYGAVRSLLGNPGTADAIDGVLLLDGLHTGYLPRRTPLAEGGRLDVEGLRPFVAFARRAARGEAAMLVTHSEIFPGTFASTTETADHLLAELGLERTPVLRWGPVGMQQLSEAGRGGFRIRGFAGNAAPDHVDHLHGLPCFLRALARLHPLPLH